MKLLVLLAQAPTKVPQWWEVSAGIIAIPVSILGLFYTIFLIRKTRLESKKIELEIIEKQTQIDKLKVADPTVAESVVNSLKTVDLVSIILKFIFLWLVVNGWSLVSDGVETIFGGVYLAAQKLMGIKDINDQWWIYIIYAVMKLPFAAYIISFIMLGSSLLKDINSLIGLNLKNLFSFKK